MAPDSGPEVLVGLNVIKAEGGLPGLNFNKVPENKRLCQVRTYISENSIKIPRKK